MVIYIHGFGSSGYGGKATEFRKYFKSIGEDFIAPTLSYVPKLAVETLQELIASYQGDVYLIGSSLGGFYATYLSKLPEVKKVVLINPAVKPIQTLQRYIGDAPNYYDNSTFKWTKEHLEMLKEYDYQPQANSKELEKFLLLLQKGDEVLNYKDAQKKYKGAKLIIEDGGNHSFENIDKHFERIREFFEIGDFFKHTTKVKGIGLELDELANRTGDLYYDNLAHFLESLSKKIANDAKADRARKRLKLAKNLENTAQFLEQSSNEIFKAWEVCKTPTFNWMQKNGFNKHDFNIDIE